MSTSASGIQGQITQLQSGTNAIQFQRGRENLGSTELGQDAFLTLLLAQLQNQDPLSPTENSEFIGQQAQFAQIEKTDKLIAATEAGNLLGQASSLVGKDVEYQLENGDFRTGHVDSVQFGDGSVGLQINGATISPTQITEIFANTPTD